MPGSRSFITKSGPTKPPKGKRKHGQTIRNPTVDGSQIRRYVEVIFESYSIKTRLWNTIVMILLMEEILNQLRLIVYPILCNDFYIPGGCVGILPSTVP